MSSPLVAEVAGRAHPVRRKVRSLRTEIHHGTGAGDLQPAAFAHIEAAVIGLEARAIGHHDLAGAAIAADLDAALRLPQRSVAGDGDRAVLARVVADKAGLAHRKLAAATHDHRAGAGIADPQVDRQVGDREQPLPAARVAARGIRGDVSQPHRAQLDHLTPGRQPQISVDDTDLDAVGSRCRLNLAIHVGHRTPTGAGSVAFRA